jgi:lysozyme family protein
MKGNFEKVIDGLLLSEGGYVDHPKDPGGATNMGITFAVLQAWRGKAITKQDVKNLTREEVVKIYRARYWDVVKADELPAGLDYAVFDFGVNSGPKRAIIGLQRLLGVADDGILGPITLQKAKEVKDLPTFINRYQDDRLRYLRQLSTFPTFGSGWVSRVERVRKASLELAGTSVEDPNTATKTGFNWAALIPIVLTALTALFGATRK